MKKVVALHAGSVEIELGVPASVSPEIASLLPKTVSFELKLEDIDKDGDSDVVFYVQGKPALQIQASTLWGNVKAEFGRAKKKVRKAVKK